MNEFPENWKMKRLGDCLEKLKSGKSAERGWSPQCLNHPVKDPSSWGVLKTTSVQMGEYQPQYNKELPKILKPKESLEVNPGDFLLTTTGPRNRCGVICHAKTTPKNLIFSGKILRFRADESEISSEWLLFLLMSPEYQKTFDVLKVGTSDSSVSIGNQQVLDLLIPVPPIDEQRKIVEVLEDHLSRLDAAMGEVKQAKVKAKQLKRSILEGVFTASHFGFEMPIKKLGDVAQVLNGDRGKNYPSRSARVTEGVPFINAGHLDNELLNIADMDFISEDRFGLLSAGKVQMQDLLFCLRGSLGKVAINDKFSSGAIASSLAIVRPSDKVLTRFLYYYFLSPLAEMEIKKYDNGTAQPNLSAANLRVFRIPLPGVNEQRLVVEFLDSEFSRVTYALNSFDELIGDSIKLRRSLLQAAFTGQLTKEVASV